MKRPDATTRHTGQLFPNPLSLVKSFSGDVGFDAGGGILSHVFQP